MVHDDVYGQDVTDPQTGKEYTIQAADIGKAGHAIQVTDAATDNILYSGRTPERNPLSALEEGKIWLEKNLWAQTMEIGRKVREDEAPSQQQSPGQEQTRGQQP